MRTTILFLLIGSLGGCTAVVDGTGQECGSDYDCGVGYVCVGAATTRCEKADCTSTCDLEGVTRCVQDNLETCALSQGCLAWEVTEDCTETGWLCQEDSDEARCVCQDLCSPEGDTTCITRATHTCTRTFQGCLDWVEDRDCSDTGQVCDDSLGVAVCVCAHECDPQESECDQNVAQNCTESMHGCRYWEQEDCQALLRTCTIVADTALCATCQIDADCDPPHCVDGVCCDQACDAICQSCIGASTGQSDGICAPVVSQEDPDGDCTGCMACNGTGSCVVVQSGGDPKGDCEADNPTTCGLDGNCDGAGGCSWYGTATLCDADSLFCTLGDHCDGSGACVPGIDPPCGPAERCDEAGQQCCIVRDSVGCENNDVYYFDSCGLPHELVENCADTREECVAGACQCAPGWSGPDCDHCRLYVNASAPFGGDGLTWNTAFRAIQGAMPIAASWLGGAIGGQTCEIWAAQGSYYIYASDRTDSVHLLSGLSLYGGFSGDGTETDLAERDWRQNPTILDGRDGPGGTNHVVHVVTGADDAVIDGFVVSHGRADSMTLGLNGGGMFNRLCSPTVRNCRFHANWAGIGGAMSNVQAGPLVENCEFTSNEVSTASGAVWESSSNSRFKNCLFYANRSNGTGGSIAVLSSDSTFESCAFVGNSGLSNSSETLGANFLNCTFYGNQSDTPDVSMATSADTFINCILWDEHVTTGVDDLAGSFVSYSNVRDVSAPSPPPGPGNELSNPFFPVLATGGQWTAVFADDTGAVELWDTVQAWADDELAGAWVRPDVTEAPWYLILGNTANTVSVWGDADTFAAIGDEYRIVSLEPQADSVIDDANGCLAPDLDILGSPRYNHSTASNGGVGPPFADKGAYEVVDGPQASVGRFESCCDNQIDSGHTYLFCDPEVTWYYARILCEDAGGHLATVTDQPENQFLEAHLAAPSWLGANDLAVADAFEWINGEVFTWENWDTGEPEPDAWSGQCLEVLQTSDTEGPLWADTFCFETRAFVCEIEP